MLLGGSLPSSFSSVLAVFSACFTAPSFRTFQALVSGLAAMPARRTVCGMLTGAGLAGQWHHSRAHDFFARAVWSVDALSRALVPVVVRTLVGADRPVLVAVDDTLFRRSGRRVHAACWHHDGAAKARSKKGGRVSWGNNWVVAGIVVWLPFASRPVCLPVAFALWRKGGPTKQVLAARLVELITLQCSTRRVQVVADAWYAGMAGPPGAAHGGTKQRRFPDGVSLIARLRRNAGLHDIAVPVPGKPGRPRRVGDKIGIPADLATQVTFTPATVHRYGSQAGVLLAEHTCLWYGAYRSQPIRVILVRDPAHSDGYQLALITTDLDTDPVTIVEHYAARWSIEVAFEDAKQTTGVGETRNRVQRAVERSVPFGLITQALIVYWYALHGHHPDDAATRRRSAPWYRTKTEPSYLDMIIKLRRVLIAARFRPTTPRDPTPHEILTVCQAWAEAAA